MVSLNFYLIRHNKSKIVVKTPPKFLLSHKYININIKLLIKKKKKEKKKQYFLCLYLSLLNIIIYFNIMKNINFNNKIITKQNKYKNIIIIHILFENIMFSLINV